MKLQYFVSRVAEVLPCPPVSDHVYISPYSMKITRLKNNNIALGNKDCTEKSVDASVEGLYRLQYVCACT